MEILKLRSTVTEMRNLLEELNSIFELAKESSNLNINQEIMQSEEQRQK